MSISSCCPIPSDTVSGDNIFITRYRSAAGSLPQHCSLHHEICINLGKYVLLEQGIDTSYQTVHSLPVDGYFSPSISDSLSSRSRSKITFSKKFDDR